MDGFCPINNPIPLIADNNMYAKFVKNSENKYSSYRSICNLPVECIKTFGHFEQCNQQMSKKERLSLYIYIACQWREKCLERKQEENRKIPFHSMGP